MFSDSHVKSWFVKPEENGLLVLEAQEKSFNSFEWIKERKVMFEDYLATHGGILLRNFNVHSVSEFNRIIQCLCPNLLDYVYRSTPRTKLGGKIYTATEYPADRSIPLHNENSYTDSWPKMICFFSILVASEGGETPIANSRNIYKRIDPAIREKFEKYGVMYIRNFSNGVDLNWKEVFQTEMKEEVERYCKEHDIIFEWKEGITELTTKQICQSSITHSRSGEKVWFNQAHLFHISSLDDNIRLSLIKELGEENVPRNAYYGNGEPIENAVLQHIRDSYEKEKIKFDWNKGDMMILDNILMAHGREPYKGERKVVVAMS